MKKIYVAHPLLGDMDRDRPDARVVARNHERVSEICRGIVALHPEVIPISPIHALAFFDPFERRQTLGICMELLKMADELWVYGDWPRSEGCLLEIKRARELGLPVMFEDGHIEGGSS